MFEIQDEGLAASANAEERYDFRLRRALYGFDENLSGLISRHLDGRQRIEENFARPRVWDGRSFEDARQGVENHETVFQSLLILHVFIPYVEELLNIRANYEIERGGFAFDTQQRFDESAREILDRVQISKWLPALRRIGWSSDISADVERRFSGALQDILADIRAQIDEVLSADLPGPPIAAISVSADAHTPEVRKCDLFDSTPKRKNATRLYTQTKQATKADLSKAAGVHYQDLNSWENHRSKFLGEKSDKVTRIEAVLRLVTEADITTESTQ